MNKNWGFPRRRWEVIHESALLSLTGTTSETQMDAVTIPGGLLGTTGALRITPLFGATVNANDKRFRFKFGGTTFLEPTSSAFDNLGMIHPVTVLLKNTSATAQVTGALTGFGTSSSGALQTLSKDTTVDQVLSMTGQLEVGTDTLQAYWQVEVLTWPV